MLMLILAAAAVATSAASPTPDQSAASSADAAKAEAAAKYVCRIEPVTGTRFSHKVCRSKEEMAQKMADDQARMRQEQRTTGGVQR